MGVINVTPDSFSDGGRNAAAADAVASARRMAADGAAILDVGGESTRPGHVPVEADTEWARVAPVLDGLRSASLPPVSIDTSKADVARRALAAGAAIVNDVWGLARDPALAEVVAESGAGLVVMHNRAAIDPAIDIVDDMMRSLEAALERARRAGIPDDAVAVDPGIGFGRTYGQSLRCLAALGRLRSFGRPILLGLSRKGFIGALSDPPRPAIDRLGGTIAGNLLGAMAGADIVRVHDVSEHVQALRLWRAVAEAAA